MRLLACLVRSLAPILIAIVTSLGFGSQLAFAGCPGCCSSHGGIANLCSTSGRIYCTDGSVSPSCTCASCGVTVAPPTPTCSGGQTWNGSACACQSGQTWASIEQVCHTTGAASACGVERWAIKTGGDAGASSVNTTPTATTIDSLISVQVPVGATTSNTRVAPIETSTYILDGTLIDYRLTEDSDYHLVLQSSRGTTMIVEAPHPDCVSPSSPFLSQIRAVRAAVDAAIAPTSSFKSTSIPVRTTGIGFFDEIHGQLGVAANGIELHPLTALTFNPSAITTQVVEFYNTNLDNYFITANADEAVAIDHGSAGLGWIRTGNSFRSGGSTSVCRFYGSLSPGPNSHFYTVDSAECQGLKDQQIPTGDPRKLTVKSWNFESLDFVSTPPTNGTCPSGTVPVYRAYNNGFARGVDSNHRITSSQTAIQQVVTRGWISEGVVMCAPN